MVLQDYLRAPGFDDDKTLRYFDAFVDLNGDGKLEAIVYLIGRDWCGSGGCPTLILEPEGSSYRVVTKMTITNPPIRVLSRSSHGWRNLAVQLSGGGGQAREAELRFDGKKYPGNPNMAPTLEEQTPGEVVIPYLPAKDGKLLYAEEP
ncbi:MAG: hypothetical protein V3T65_07975 [Acidobacteriota bacterium]